VVVAATRDAARLFLELGTVTIVLAVGARLAARTGFSSIPLYLLAGVVLGALAPPTLDDVLVTTVSEVGIVLLLFTLGLEYSALELAAGLRAGLRGGLLDAVLNFPPGFLVGLLMGWGLVGALVLGGITYVSSSGIVAKVIADLGRARSPETPRLLSLLVLEDLAMALYLPLVGVALVGSGVATAVVSAAVALLVVGSIFVLALRHGNLVGRAVWDDSDEVLVLSTMGLLLLVAGLTERAHVSAAVGAFLLGIALSGPVAERARAVVWPMRDLFAAMFFLFFALQLELGALPAVLVPALVLIGLSAVAKTVTGWLAAAGLDAAARLRAGTALIAHGEFSIVIAGLALGGSVDPELGELAAAYVLGTAILGPLATRYAAELTRFVPQRRAGMAV
jgi:CPA2 family monovalent cation:H+ antiporter-2